MLVQGVKLINNLEMKAILLVLFIRLAIAHKT